MLQRPASCNGRIQDVAEMDEILPCETTNRQKICGTIELEEPDDNSNRRSRKLQKVLGVSEDTLEESTTKEYKLSGDRDSGWAWVVLAAATIISVCIDGMSFSFGLFRAEFAKNFKATEGKTSLVGSMFIALPLLTGPLISALVDVYGCRVVSMIAGLTMTIALLISAASESVPMLFFTYGVLGGLSVGVMYVTSIVSISMWFDEKRNLAVSIVSCSFGVGPLIFSPLIQHILKNYCLSAAFIVVAGVLLHLCVCAALLRNHPSTGTLYKNKIKVSKKVNSLTSVDSTSLKRLSETETHSSLEVTRSTNHQADCNTDPATLAVPIEPKEVITTTSDRCKDNDEENKRETLNTDEYNENDKSTVRGQNQNKKTEQRKSWKAKLSDHGYLKGITLFRNYMVHRGAMTSIPKYRLRSALRPDVYGNSNWSMNSDAQREYVPCLRICLTPEITGGEIQTFTKFGFIMFNLSVLNTYAWSIFPYFFLKSLLDEKKIDTGLWAVSIVAVTAAAGTVFCGWARERPWMKIMMTYRASLFLCGLSLLVYPLLPFFYLTALISIVFGVSLASTHFFTTAILMDLIPIDNFTMGYCVVLLVQGLGFLIGPPIGGMLFDLTGEWSGTFWLAGTGMVLAGVCACFVTATPEGRPQETSDSEYL